jgi:hypothetical protein
MRLIIAGGVIVVPPDGARVIGSRVSVIIESCISVIRSRVVRSSVSVIGSRVSVIIESCVRPRRIHRTVGHCLGASLGGARTGYTGSERD